MAEPVSLRAHLVMIWAVAVAAHLPQEQMGLAALLEMAAPERPQLFLDHLLPMLAVAAADAAKLQTQIPQEPAVLAAAEMDQLERRLL